MKKTKIIFLFVFVAFGSSTQEYHPLVKDWATWIATYSYRTNETQSYQFTMKGDSLINDTLFKKVYHTAIDETFPTDEEDLIGYIYEDSSKRVYYKGRIMDYSKEHPTFLLYDFNLQVGDTFRYPQNVYDDSLLVVWNIDSILVDGNYRKRINFNHDGDNCQEHDWIEGIGSGVTLFGSVICYQGGPQNQCYFDSTTFHSFQYINSEEACFSVSVAEKEKPELVKVFVSGNNLQVELEHKSPTFDLQLFDSSGRLVLRQSINETSSLVNLEDFHGFFVVKLLFKDGSSFQQKVVMN